MSRNNPYSSAPEIREAYGVREACFRFLSHPIQRFNPFLTIQQPTLSP